MNLSLERSVSSSFGKFTSKLFDEYPIYQCYLSKELIENVLPHRLPAFASISSSNLVKRHFFYSKPIIFASRSQIKDDFLKNVSLLKFEDFFENLLLKTSDHIRYNFVLTSNCLIFVEIPHIRHLTYHLLCKHITLANRSIDVRFAGEFWRNDQLIYQFNNNSGTYRPSNHLIEKTQEIFQKIAPKLNFQGISFQLSIRPSFKYRFRRKYQNRFPNKSSFNQK